MNSSHDPSLQSPSLIPLSPRTATRSKGRNHLFAGSFGGLVASGLLQPFDVVKTRIQQGSHGSLMSVIYKTIGDGENRKISKLWRGTLPSILRSSMGSGLYFFTLNEMRQHLATTDVLRTASSGSSRSKIPVLSGSMNLVTGATARAAVGFLMMPITIIKVRYESDLYAYKSIVHAAREIHKAHGAKGFFYGFGATAIRDAPYAGLYVYVYELCKAYLSQAVLGRRPHDREGTTMSRWGTLTINFTSGLTAGFGATLLTNPFDVMRTRMQLRPNMYKNFWTAAKRLYVEEGPRSFLDGVGLRIARKSISSAFTWSLYEFVLASI